MDKTRIVDAITKLMNKKFEAFAEEHPEDNLEEIRPYTQERVCDGMSFIDGIPSKYFDLLETFSIKFFDDGLSNKEIDDYLDVIIEMMAEYFELSKIPIAMDLLNQNVPKYDENDRKRKLNTFRSTAKKLLKITVCDTIDSPLHNRLATELKSVINNPERYLFPKTNIKSTSVNDDFLKPLKEYLDKFDFKKRKTIKQEFIENLTKITQEIHR